MRRTLVVCLHFLFLFSGLASAQTQVEIEAQVRAAHEALLTKNGTDTALAAIWDRNQPGEKFLLREFLLNQLRTKLEQHDYKGIGQTASFVAKKIYFPGDKEIVELLVETLEAPIGTELIPLLSEIADVFHLKSMNVPDENSRGGVRSKTYGEIASDVDPGFFRAYEKYNAIGVMSVYAKEFARNPNYPAEPVRDKIAANIKDALSNWDTEVRTAALRTVIVILKNGVQGVLDNELLGLCYGTSHDQQESNARSAIHDLVADAPPGLTDHLAAKREQFIRVIDEVLTWLMSEESGRAKSTREYLLKMATALNVRAPIVNDVYVQKIMDMLEAAKFRGFDLLAQVENIQYFTDLAGKILRTDLRNKTVGLFPFALKCVSTYVH